MNSLIPELGMENTSLPATWFPQNETHVSVLYGNHYTSQRCPDCNWKQDLIYLCVLLVIHSIVRYSGTENGLSWSLGRIEKLILTLNINLNTIVLCFQFCTKISSEELTVPRQPDYWLPV